MRFRTRFGVVALAVVLVAGLVACQPDSAPYVALGDSYTAGPLVPDQSLEPLGCLRSSNSWPQVAARTAGTPVLDVSCSGADTNDMFSEQGVTPGPNAPQLDAVKSDTKVVTVQIGGNDIGFSSIVKDCVRLNTSDAPCKDRFVTASGDALAQRVDATKPKVVSVLNAVKAKAPGAKVLVVGYPSILPENSNGCWPAVPILPADVTYLRGVHKRLNSMIQSAATTTGTTYIDIYTPTLGHDACSSSKWVEPVIPTTLAAPVHPNRAGLEAVGAILAPHVKAAL